MSGKYCYLLQNRPNPKFLSFNSNIRYAYTLTLNFITISQDYTNKEIIYNIFKEQIPHSPTYTHKDMHTPCRTLPCTNTPNLLQLFRIVDWVPSGFQDKSIKQRFSETRQHLIAHHPRLGRRSSERVAQAELHCPHSKEIPQSRQGQLL